MTIRNDDHIRSFLADEARRAMAAAPSFDEAIRRLAPRFGESSSGASRRLVVLLAATLLLAAALGTAIAVGSGLLRPPLLVDHPDLGIFEPAAGRVLSVDNDGLWAVDPDAPSPVSTRVRVELGGTGTAGYQPHGWSGDGTELMFGLPGQLFVLHADGSATEVTQALGLDRLTDIHGGAAISPDGSRVVFVGLTRASGGGCCDYALYAVDADGGPAEVLVKARFRVQDPTFSPDGTQIAFVDSSGDHSQNVWLVNADGTDAHQILANETTAAAGQANGLAWSPAGGRMALGLDGTVYTFAPDGSGFTAVITGGDDPQWSPDGLRLAYAVPCSGDAIECGFAIADADGSNARELGFGILGPWHPARR